MTSNPEQFTTSWGLWLSRSCPDHFECLTCHLTGIRTVRGLGIGKSNERPRHAPQRETATERNGFSTAPGNGRLQAALVDGNSLWTPPRQIKATADAPRLAREFVERSTRIRAAAGMCNR